MHYFVRLVFASLSATGLATAVDLVVVGGNNALCTGASVTLQCTLTGYILTWNTPEGALNFVRGRQTESNVGPYQGQLQELNTTHLRSTLTFTFTAQISISCSDGSGSGSGSGSASNTITIIVEGPPSAPEQPRTALDRISRLNNTFSSVFVVWNIPNTNNAHISSYLVTVEPPIPLPASGVIAADNSLFNSRQLTLTLLHGQQYNIRVRAKSCHDTVEGSVSAALSIKVQVPPTVARCTALPVYDYYSNNLTRIEIEWDPILDVGEEITAGITASVQNYIISAVPVGIAVPAINASLGASDSRICTDTKCNYNFQRSSEMSALYYSVYITAKNHLSDGYSDRQNCSNVRISVINDLLSVEINIKNSGDLEVLCSHTNGVAECVATYNILPTSYANTSDSTGDESENVQTIRIVLLKPVVVVKVSLVGGSQDAAVLGVFETGELNTTQENLTQCNSNGTDNKDSPYGTDSIQDSSNGSADISCDFQDIDISTLVAVPISLGTVLCIISCLIGALLHRTLTTHSCRRLREKQATPDEPHNIYDEIAADTERNARPSARVEDKKTLTINNQAYSEVQLARSYIRS